MRLQKSAWRAACVVLAWLFVSLSGLCGRALADQAEAAFERTSIAVLLSQPADRCFETGVVAAIKHFVDRQVAALNALPEFAGRQLRVDYYNDYSDADTAVANMRQILENQKTLAIVGLSGSNRAKAVFEKLGSEIAARNIPFITDLSATSLFDAFPNTFTMRPSQENERVPILMRFLKDGKFSKPAFIGLADNAATDVIAKLLSETSDGPGLVYKQFVPVKDGAADAAALSSAVKDLVAADADVTFVMLGTAASEQFLREASTAQLRSDVFLLTDNDAALRTDTAKTFATNLYQLAWQSLPEVYNARLRRLMLAKPEERWVFPDVINRSAKGWADNTCKMPAEGVASRPLDSVNQRTLSRATRFGDMVGLIGEVLQLAPQGASLSDLRARIIRALGAAYAAGRGTYAGEFSNWSFHPLQRTVSDTPLILKKPRTSQNVRLAPRQYLKSRNETLQEVKTVYMDVDLTRLFRVDDNEKSFFAEFFLSMDEENAIPVSSIEFTNAFYDADSGGQKLTIEDLNQGDPKGTMTGGMRLYKVTGKFMLRPDYSHYPFDVQRFSIEIKPKNGNAGFIVQPPAASLRDRVFETDGWSLRDQYVAYDEDYIPITDARTDEKSIIPYYKAEFSYVMQREATDYYLRVVVPLAFILIVAFLSIYIPRDHFEAVVTIQVTALLSAVALYLSIPKVGNDAATISDRIFLIDYMAVSAMIAISIARVNPYLRHWPLVDRVLKWLHVLGMPVLIAVLAYMLADLAWQGPLAFDVEQEQTVLPSSPHDKPAKL